MSGRNDVVSYDDNVRIEQAAEPAHYLLANVTGELATRFLVEIKLLRAMCVARSSVLVQPLNDQWWNASLAHAHRRMFRHVHWFPVVGFSDARAVFRRPHWAHAKASIEKTHAAAPRSLCRLAAPSYDSNG